MNNPVLFRKIKKQKSIFLGVTIISFSVILGLAVVLSSNQGNNQLSDGLPYSATVCNQVIRADGTHETPECSHNILYDAGRNITRNLLMLASGDTVTNITLCNTTSPSTGGCGTPVAGATEAFTLYGGCGLSTTAQASTSIMGQFPGNWSVYQTFTSTCDNQLINMSRLGNDSTYFAGNTFSLVTLQTNDQLTVNWTISIP